VVSLRVATVRRVVGWAMALVLVASLAAWYVSREPLPSRIRIATAERGGLYYRFGSLLAPKLEARLGRVVEVLETRGSAENRRLLSDGEAELALLQGELAAEPEVAALAPLYQDVVHVVVRAGGGPKRLEDLVERRVAIGDEESGMHRTAELVMRHYGLLESARPESAYFSALESDPELDAAIVTTGLLNPELDRLLAGGAYALLPIPDGAAIAARSPFLRVVEIPRGFFRERPPVPHATLETLATTTVLCASRNAPPGLVTEALEALYDGFPRRELPILMSRGEAAGWEDVPRHAAAQSFYQPYSGLGILADMMESLAALKELLFALGAAAYLGFTRWQRAKERERLAAMTVEKERLDDLFQETMAIEHRQMGSEDATELRRALDDVTRIKLRALEELTHEDLRGDVTFAIFLQQCANLTRKIQSKVEFLSQGGRYPSAGDEEAGEKV
jgi:uncharacterized protein